MGLEFDLKFEIKSDLKSNLNYELKSELQFNLNFELTSGPKFHLKFKPKFKLTSQNSTLNVSKSTGVSVSVSESDFSPILLCEQTTV